MASVSSPDAFVEVRLVPTIKGIFVKSHVEAVRRALGDEAVDELSSRFGGNVEFSDLVDVPVRDEVRIIEIANDLLTHGGVPRESRAFEGGRLHFRNFKATPLARLMFAIFPRNFRYLMMHTPTIAGRVFKGVHFEATQVSSHELVVVMENNDYSLDHFRGLFQEWMADFGLHGTVEGEITGPRRYEYRMRWAE